MSEQLLSKILGKLESIDTRLSNVENRIGSLEDRMGNVEEQSGETNQIVKALMHRTEELDAKFDGLLHTVVTKECIAPLATREDIARIAETQELHTQWLRKLSADTTQHELEINRLKVAK